ncbi:MBL fold metallo-hydrolase [Frigoribacterium sp. Leaf263]|uniref:MBL fold metallo-hydrolase n=1 Tax=Frigoribacterium sp. Leaf263 TaxID=1736313 RepID=UPI000A627D0E|nr:MBL fold metallo-hydrolase [Frigoribacterium sp. Leaf263]
MVLLRPSAVLERDVVAGVHRLEVADTNLYLVEHDDRVLVVDAGLPAAWPYLLQALFETGHGRDDVDGVLLTHAHFDHVGCARQVRRRWGLPVWVHDADARLAAHPYAYRHERPRWRYPVEHRAALPALARMTLAGALAVRGVRDTRPLGSDTPLPTGAVVIPTPGHTDGHIALHLPDRDAVIVGDALVTLDPYTGERGPQIVAGAATADSDAALASLDALVATGAGVVLPGHGAPWREGVGRAVELARRRGAH